MTNNMSTPKIFALIKTPCGRAKYSELSLKNNLFGKLRLYWFVFIAIIKDWRLPNTDQTEDSSS